MEGASAAAHALSLPAEAYGNDPRLEVMWAMKAYNHAEVYFNLISSVDPKFLKLTKLDDKIYSTFRETFKELDIKLLKPDDLKSDEAKEPRLEVMWAMKAYNHAEVYFNLISSVDPKFLKLTKLDDKIYSTFRETFKELDIKLLKPDDLKSDEAKETWRPFCNQFEGLIEDFNYGTLLRLDCEKDYTEENTIFATRVQFFAVEIARNREGYNNTVFMSKSSKS
ncbi:hypothetical protein EPR50_G00173190 [Perca flavescens]|uniref:Polysaccharide biosynthesis domain-containing protein n=2 Tax=Perca flavescens TaxID=8167 RepID=A0A484CFC8_PERFV|nr:hypothetical protein EPR50_G00173190 [Perca flavescens]